MFFSEVIELHHFIQDWLTGSVEKTREVFSRFHDVLINMENGNGSTFMKRGCPMNRKWELMQT